MKSPPISRLIDIFAFYRLSFKSPKRHQISLFKTLYKNSRVRGFRGLSKITSGEASSATTPLSINITLVETSLANCISCVTTSIVSPVFASVFITDKTSPTISGSSAEVGSSNKSTSGFIASARAIATLCFCPPES